MGMLSDGNPRPVVDCSVEPSRTKQSFKDASDVNVIMQRARQGAMVTHLSSRHPVYADVSAMTDFRESLEHVQAVEVFFDQLPADVREYFANEPVAFLDYMNDPGRSVDDLKALGLRIMDDDRFNDPPPRAVADPAAEPVVE